MTGQTPTPKTPTNKPLITFLIVGGVLLAAALIALIVMLFSAPDTTQPETPGKTEKLNASTVPKVTDFKVTATGDTEYTVNFTIPEPDNKYAVEYRIANNKTRVLAEGETLETAKIEEQITVSSNDTSITLSLRTNSGVAASSWVAQETYELENSVPTSTHRGLNEKYYTTPWALETDTSIKALNSAVEIAYNAKPYSDTEAIQCSFGGDSDVGFGEIIPPTPETLDDSYLLRYETYPSSGDQYHLYWYWCYTA